jgi:hypothetical protein
LTVSIATAMPAPTAVYREEQLFAWWIYLVVALTFTVSCLYLTYRPDGDAGRGGLFPATILVIMTAMPLITAGFLRMTTQVTSGVVEVWFGWFPTYRRRINVGSISRVEVITYNPLKDCGGWGIRATRDGERVLNARGDRGVRLHFVDGTRLLIGSQQAEVLAAAIERAIHPG